MKRNLLLPFVATMFFLLGTGGLVSGETQNVSEKNTFTVTYQIVNYPYAGTISASVGGEYLPSGGTVNEGANVDFSVITNWGFLVQDWVINGVSYGMIGPYYTYENVQSNLTVDVFLMEYTYPQITPTHALFALNDPQNVIFTVDYGSESSILHVIREDWQTGVPDTLELGTEYTISGNQLTILASYIQSLNPQIFDTFGFRVVFGLGTTVWINIAVVGTTVPLFDPAQLTYDLSNPGDVFTFIVYADANELVSLEYNNTPLVLGVHYNVERTKLTISQSFLVQHLQSAGQSITLVGTFDNQETATIQITAVQTGVVNASINPTSAIYNRAQMPSYIDITITWNGASEVTGLLVRWASSYGVMEFPWSNYQVTNLGGGQARLRIFLDEDKAESLLKTKGNIYHEDYQILISFNQGAPASFILTIFTVTYEVNVTVVPSDGGFVNGAWEYEEGDDVFLQAVPNWGYAFSRWEDQNGTVLGTNPVLTFTMPASDVNLTAYFVPGYQIFYWANNPNGSLEAYHNGELVISGATVPQGDRVVFKATPDPGYKVEFWTLNGANLPYDGLEYIIDSVNQDISISVTFEPIPTGYNMVTYSVLGGNGVLSAMYNQSVLYSGGVVPLNASVTFTAAPDDGYRIKEWTVNDEVVPDFTESQLTVSNITAALHVTVEFEQIVSIGTKPSLSFTIYPNPIESVASISTSVELKRISLVNVIGQTVLSVEKPANHVNLTELSSGMYVIVAETINGDIITKKVIKK